MDSLKEQQLNHWLLKFGISPDVIILGEPYLLPETVADQIQVKLGTLATWRSLGKGPKPTKVGNNILYHLTETKRWVDSR